MAEATIGKWGNNLAVRLPGKIAEAARLRDGETVLIETQGDALVVRRIDALRSLADIFRGHSPEFWREEYAGSYEWGPDLGREALGK